MIENSKYGNIQHKINYLNLYVSAVMQNKILETNVTAS